MDFIDRIQELGSRIPKQLDYCKTEEATKNALVMPFINALGYDVFNPTEVMPEYTADIGIKKGEKIDYAIFQNGSPIMLFECKCVTADLCKVHASQLYRYFATLPAVRFGILTNGLVYQFYSDLDAPNVMDAKPFFTFNILDFQDRHVDELKKFTKSTFDLGNILTTASELKYTNAIRQIINREFEEPSEDFVIFLAKQVYAGWIMPSVKELFTDITKKALKRFLTDQINERLKSALEGTSLAEAPPVTAVTETTAVVEAEEVDDSVIREDKVRGIVTTKDEIEAFFIVKSILRDEIGYRRIHVRDAKSYCSVLLDDNNHKPIVRLRFNGNQKQIGLITIVDGDKAEERIAIDEIDDIFQYTEPIKAIVQAYDSE